MDVAFRNFSNNPPKHAYVDDVITLLIMLHSKCTGPFYESIAYIGVLGIGPRKKIIYLCCVPLVLICKKHPCKCGESFCCFCILLLRLDVLRCNLEIELFVSRF